MSAVGQATRRQRLDVLLVERGLAASRQAAQALIMAGRVRVEGRIAAKAGERVAVEADVDVAGPLHPYVGRGGVKLAGALEGFRLDVGGLTGLDIGSSTGGFTDCLLQRGASRVIAVDVGHGQLDWRLRQDPRVVVREGINARYLGRDDLPELAEGADFAVVDVSFISLRLILPRVAPLLRSAGAGPAWIVALVKPQFEAGRGEVGRGGIVRDPEARARAIRDVAGAAMQIGLAVRGMSASVLEGAEGNQEYFVHLEAGTGGLTPAEIEEHAGRLTRI
jgi:23S rRNA (cytidine1920-2'-O)/16S rRNA (cytidine1409-2'-O)-methyltransferase